MKIISKFLLICILGIAPSIFADEFTNGLVAYYPFNGNANDESLNGNNGTVSGAVLTTDRFGAPNRAYSFNGSSGYISVGSNNSLQLTNDLTISSWINFAGTTQNFFDVVTKHRRNINNEGTWVEIIAGNLFDFDATPYFDGSNLLPSAVPTGVWRQYVVTYSRTSQIWSVYLDGVAIASSTKSFNIQNNGYNLVIGAENDPGSNPPYANFFKGNLDDIRIYNRVLSSNEVSQLYAIESSLVSIAGQPTSLTNHLGDNVALSVSALGADPKDYTWYFSGTKIDNGTNNSLIIDNISQEYFGNYFVIITNAFSCITSSVAAIFEPVTIIGQPSDVIVPAFSPATFTVSAVGFPPPTFFLWTFNQTNKVGLNSDTLSISNIQIANAGNYQVFASNSISSASSGIATLNVSPSIYTPFLGAIPIWGNSATLSVGVIGSGTLTYQWYFNGQPIEGANYPQLNFASIQFTNAGFYYVVASSQYGSVTNAAYEVVVNPAGVNLGFYAGLTLTGTAGYSYIIQSSTNLANTNGWVTLTNLILDQNVQLWIDTNADASSPFNSKIFYKILPGQ